MPVGCDEESDVRPGSHSPQAGLSSPHSVKGRAMILRLLALVLMLTAAAEAQTKRAFIVGVADYVELTDLHKTIGDAEGYRGFFEGELGYVTSFLTDPTETEFLDAFDAFKQSISPGDEVVFIFSGHGWSDGAENYLALKDAPRNASESTIKRSTVPLATMVLADLEARKPSLVFAVIDACRDNPFDTLTRDYGRGLVPVQQRKGTMVVFAAGARQKALDRLSDDDASGYSVFTRVLLPRLRNTSRPLVDIVDETRDEVERLAATVGNPQRPAVYSDVSRRFCFEGECAPRTRNAELDALSRIQNCESANDFLSTYPDSPFRATAETAALALCEGETAPISTEFQRLLGGDRLEVARDIVADTRSGGAWLIGRSYRRGNSDPEAWIGRVGPDGSVIDEVFHGGPAWDDVFTALPAADGGLWLVGSKAVAPGFLTVVGRQTAWEAVDASRVGRSDVVVVTGRVRNWHLYPPGSADIWVARTDAEGQIVFQQTYGLAGRDDAVAMAPTIDGGFWIAAYTEVEDESDVRIMRFGPDGRLSVDRTLDLAEEDLPVDILSARDGGAWLLTSNEEGDQEIALYRLGADGGVISQTFFGGLDWDAPIGLAGDGSDGLWLASNTESKGAGEADGWLLKLDRNGNLVFDKVLGGEDFDELKAIASDGSGGVWLTGTTWPTDEYDQKMWVMLVDESGNVLLERTFGSDDFDSSGAAITAAANGGAWVLGVSDTENEEQLRLVKLRR